MVGRTKAEEHIRMDMAHFQAKYEAQMNEQIKNIQTDAEAKRTKVEEKIRTDMRIKYRAKYERAIKKQMKDRIDAEEEEKQREINVAVQSALKMDSEFRARN